MVSTARARRDRPGRVTLEPRLGIGALLDTRGSRAQNRRPTIGLLIPGDSSSHTPALWSGVFDVVHERGAHLIRFSCTENDSPDTVAASLDLIHHLASASAIDGVILGPGTAQSYVDQHRSLPMVSIGEGVQGVPQVLVEHPLSPEHAWSHFYAQGRRAAEMLFVMLKNRPVPDQVRVPAPSIDGDPLPYAATPACMHQRDLLLHRTGHQIHNALDLDELAQTVSQQFSRLDIPACSVVLCGRHPRPMLPLTSKIVLGYDERGPLILPGGGQRFPTRKLLPGHLFGHTEPHTLAVEALFFRGQALGYVVFQVGPQQTDVYHILAEQLGSALGRIVTKDQACSPSVEQAA